MEDLQHHRTLRGVNDGKSVQTPSEQMGLLTVRVITTFSQLHDNVQKPCLSFSLARGACGQCISSRSVALHLDYLPLTASISFSNNDLYHFRCISDMPT